MVALAAIVLAIGTPMAAAQVDAGRVRQAAGFIAARFRLARQEAATRSASVAVVFDAVGGRTTFRLCTDGNGDGVRRSDITAGVDACVDGPYDIEGVFAGVRIASDAAIRGPDGEAGSTDAIRFGRSDMASFSPIGTSTSGSVFLQSRTGQQYVVRLAGSTTRTRVLRYDTATRAWREG